MESKSGQKELGIDTLYKERGDFILIGLTGRVGSGCSTTAHILKKDFQEIDFPFPKRDNFNDAEDWTVRSFC